MLAFVYHIAYFGYNRQKNKELNFIYGRKGKNDVSSLLKNHILHNIPTILYTVRLIICWFDSVFCAKKEDAIRQRYRAPPSKVIEAS